ncbi:MAG: hypothetical protein ACK5B9_12235 [Flavobacteriia bacterium]|jgi:hypothetical protein
MHQKDELETVIETDKFIVGKRKDGIIHVFYKQNSVIDIPFQEELIKAHQEITKNTKSNFIFEADKGVKMTRAARNNATKIQEEACIGDSVLFVQNRFYQLIGEFFSKVNKPKGNYRFMTNFQEGIDWLKLL